MVGSMTGHGASRRRCTPPCVSRDKTTAHGRPRRTCLTEAWQIGGYSIGKCAVVSTCAVVVFPQSISCTQQMAHYRKKSTIQPTTPMSSRTTIAVTSSQVNKRKPTGTLDRLGVLSFGSELPGRRSSAWTKAVSTKPTAAIANKKVSMRCSTRLRQKHKRASG